MKDRKDLVSTKLSLDKRIKNKEELKNMPRMHGKTLFHRKRMTNIYLEPLQLIKYLINNMKVQILKME